MASTSRGRRRSRLTRHWFINVCYAGCDCSITNVFGMSAKGRPRRSAQNPSHKDRRSAVIGRCEPFFPDAAKSLNDRIRARPYRQLRPVSHSFAAITDNLEV